MNELLFYQAVNVLLILGITMYLIFKSDEHKLYKILEKREEYSTLNRLYVFVISNQKEVKQIIVSKEVYWNYNVNDRITAL